MPKHVDKVIKTYNYIREEEDRSLASGGNRLMPWGLNELYFVLFAYISLAGYIYTLWFIFFFFHQFVFGGYITTYWRIYTDCGIWCQNPSRILNHEALDAMLAVDYMIIINLD
jgi:hypothetical protein